MVALTTPYLIVFRGHWCPFCISYLRALEQLRPSIEAAGGKTIAITSEPETHLSQTRAASGYNGTVLVDTSHITASSFRREGIVDVAISDKGGYQKGMSQPAITVLKKNADGKEKVLYRWAIVPSMVG